MDRKKQTVLLPEYMLEFSCLGSDCTDNCCNYWYIAIDQDTYLRYQSLADIEYKTWLNKNLKLNQYNPLPNNYASIRLTSNDRICPFLSENKLCRIHLELGEDYLGKICLNYPRQVNIINGRLEKSASLSCPQAARLALLNPHGIKFREVEEGIEISRLNIRQQLYVNKENLSNQLEGYLGKLRSLAIQILQNRSYPLSSRLAILRMFSENLEKYVQLKEIEQIPPLISSYSQLLRDASLEEQAEQKLFPDFIEQVRLLKHLIDRPNFSTDRTPTPYLECVQQFFSGLQYSKAMTVEKLAHNYQEAYLSYYQPFLNSHEYILENYLTNYVFQNTFPFGRFSSVFNEYLLLLIHYTMIEMLLVGIAAFHRGLTTDLFIKLICSFSKAVSQNRQYLHYLLDLFKRKGFTAIVEL